VDEIARIEYPAHTSTKNGNNQQLGKDYMKFNIQTQDHRVFHLLASNQQQLTLWVVGLQNLFAKPGQVRQFMTESF
jgi:hypothetical protein